MKRTTGARTKTAPPARPPRRLVLSVQYASHAQALPSRAEVRRWVRACWSGAAEVTVRFVDEEEGGELNAGYRGKAHPTNVLSFPYAMEPALAGDLVLCAPVVEREAVAQGKAAQAHYAHLIVHGMLHLQGFDHEDDQQAAHMEAREREILAGLGYPDPYASDT